MNLETENEQLRTRLAEMTAEVERLTAENARPIPAQQSPRITEQEDNLAVLVSQELYSKGGAHESQIDVARRIIGFIASRLPQRVTEQDAREIAVAYALHRGTEYNKGYAEMFVDQFFATSEGRALLDKLNGDKNAR